MVLTQSNSTPFESGINKARIDIYTSGANFVQSLYGRTPDEVVKMRESAKEIKRLAGIIRSDWSDPRSELRKIIELCNSIEALNPKKPTA